MASLAALFVCISLGGPLLAGANPFRRPFSRDARPARTAVLGNQNMGVLPLVDAALPFRRSLGTPSLGVGSWAPRPMGRLPPARATDPSTPGAANVGSCLGKSRCAPDYVCTRLLDAEGKPLNWASDQTYWDITQQGDEARESAISNGEGDSRCISVWGFSFLINKAGCENVQIRCDATDVFMVQWRWALASSATSCLQKHCYNIDSSARETNLRSTPIDAHVLREDSRLFAAAVGGGSFAAAACVLGAAVMALSGSWRRAPSVAAVPILG